MLGKHTSPKMTYFTTDGTDLGPGQWMSKRMLSYLLQCSDIDVSLQCFDAVGWATGRYTGLQQTGCWFVGGDILHAALRVLQLQLSPPIPSPLASIKKQNGDILVPANPGPPGK